MRSTSLLILLLLLLLLFDDGLKRHHLCGAIRSTQIASALQTTMYVPQEMKAFGLALYLWE